jgi:hypothetical protein
MKNRKARRGSVAGLVAAVVVVGTIVAYAAATGSADGRTLNANFCASPLPHLCLQVNGTAYDAATHVAGQPDMTLEPGTYWVTVTDDSNFHNFAFRSCPGNDPTALCDNSAANAAAPVQVFSPLNNAPANVTSDMNCSATGGTLTCTYKLLLKHGTYRLICQATGHENGGMFVDIAVGGDGQVD